MDKIKENDFNLNIPCYVDIFGKELIDVEALAKELKVGQKKERDK